jgi:hypothetical protein
LINILNNLEMNRDSDLSFDKRKRNSMKNKSRKNELDVDFIQSRLMTKEEEIALSEYIKAYKVKRKKTTSKKAARTNPRCLQQN